MRLTTVLLLALVLCVASFGSGNGGSALVAAKASKKKAKKEKPVEVVDLMLDVAGNMCTKLGALVKRPRFDAAKRCDLLKFCIEDLAGMFDAMANELELTQLDLVNNALQPQHFFTMKMNLKKMVKMVLAEKKPTEDWVAKELNGLMSQWVLNVAVNNKDDSSNGLSKLGREAQRNIRSLGIKLPSHGMDADDTEEEDALLGEDFAWAEQENKGAAAGNKYDEDDDDDN